MRVVRTSGLRLSTAGSDLVAQSVGDLGTEMPARSDGCRSWGRIATDPEPGDDRVYVILRSVMQVGSSSSVVETSRVPTSPLCSIVSVALIPRGTHRPMNPLS